MNIAIIGAGAVGTDLARLLAADPEVTRIRCLSRDDRDLTGVLAIGSGKLSAGLADARDPRGVAEAVGEAELLVNASLPRFNEALLATALVLGSDYLDLASELEDLETPEQLRFHGRFEAAGRTALINAGVAPGLTNLLVRLLRDRHPHHERFRIRLLEEEAGDDLVFSWSPETTIDDVTAPPLVYEGGTFRLISPFANEEAFDFGPPFGARTVWSLYGDEVATIPRFLAIRDLDFKSGGSDIDKARAAFLAGSIRRGMAPPASLPSANDPGRGRETVPYSEARLVVAAVSGPRSAGDGDGPAGLRVVFPALAELRRRSPGATYISWPTAVCAHACLKALPEARQAGVFPPEAFGEAFRRWVLAVLEAHGVRVEPLAGG